MNIHEKIDNNQEIIGVIGLGYVGLPLAVAFAEAGVHVIGFDKSQSKVDKVNHGENYIKDIRDAVLKEVVNKVYFRATTDFSELNQCDAILICVPTPLDRFRKPDMSYIESACISIGQNMKREVFICLESTTYPTTTENVMLPIIEKESGMKVGKDFWLAYSPERVDPGNKNFHTKNTPKVLGAMTSEGLEIGKKIYSKAIDHIYPVSSPRVAEMVKILENTYRLINISLINELALLSGKMDINIWEVIEAAKTKPFGFQAFYPGPGIGGHCIPLDPFYLEHIAKMYEFDLSMIHTAGHINMRMPHYMYIKINTALNRQKKPVNGSKVFFLGVAYKPNIDDERESPALEIIDEVVKKGGVVSYNDPFISQIKTCGGNSFSSIELSPENLSDADVVVISTKHSAYDFEMIRKHAKMIVDLQNAYSQNEENIYKL
ncbi:MAG: nucleotide sugar dehydrogenase [Bacteroidales bacterium]|jgi:UDP-N-acetyl-D-glucosamine dehydrogenase|nr:nucleotide sugar dehydrogenase [Bacteroidales bacterium]